MHWDFIIISGSEIPIIFLSMDLCERFGRKFTTTAPMLVVGLACIGIGFTPREGVYKIVRVSLGMLGKCLVGSNMNTICTWSSELYTTQMRGAAMGWFQAFIRLGAAVAPWLDKLMAPSSFLLMGLLSFLSFGVLLFLPETQGTITADAEDEDGEGGEDGRVFKSTDVDQLQCNNHNNNNNKYDNDNNNNKNDREIEIDHLESYGNNALEVTD